ncbi:hypothetical protein [Micromonospora sp. AMSO31t]|uniref:hypothetical protein n=1 Tax=Micromonospora sp. AMSO31t TaxID=2650566 RepID=UPI00124B8917|nr:hypothetical protein [Micromonospora sp. AMSO31t]KAB1909224.1 hypothetical protein F8274_22350 [Micromonospora sp. AMSO31t]
MNRLWPTVLTGLLALTTVAPLTAAGPASAGAPAARATEVRTPAGGPASSAATEVRVLSVHGAGPYRIGARLDRLSAAGLIDWTAPGCAGVQHAGATGAWAGVILLAFRNGRLVSVGTATVPPRSPAGASVGMSFPDLERRYGRRGALIRNDAGDAEAYLVRFGSRVELFTGHPIRPGVGYFEVGPASFVERNFRQGGSC